MAVYLVEYENVNAKGLNGLEALTDDDRFYIFYSEHANKLSFDVHERLKGAKAKTISKGLDVGSKNALDIQLSSFLGYLIGNDTCSNYYIVSKDQGFNKVVGFWRKEKSKLKLVKDLSGYTRQQAIKELEKQLKGLFEDVQEVKFVKKSIVELTTKSDINSRLQVEYGNMRAGEILKKIKPLIKDKKGK